MRSRRWVGKARRLDEERGAMPSRYRDHSKHEVVNGLCMQVEDGDPSDFEL